jgi:hypothetical protein
MEFMLIEWNLANLCNFEVLLYIFHTSSAHYQKVYTAMI